MGNPVRVLVIVAATAALAASATAPVKHAITKADDVNASIDATWNALIDLFADRGWSIKTMDRTSGLIATDPMRVDAEGDAYADCGGAGFAAPTGTTVRFNVRVKAIGTKTRLTVNASFQQMREQERREFTVDCESRGAVEEMIHNEVRARIGREQPKAEGPANAAGLFFCTAAPADASVASCARSAEGCEKRKADIVALAGDATSCAQQAKAVCFRRPGANAIVTESCHPTVVACARPHDEAVSASTDGVTACVDQ